GAVGSGSGGPTGNGLALADWLRADAAAQPHPASVAASQPRAAVSDQGDPNAAGAALAPRTVPGCLGSLGAGPAVGAVAGLRAAACGAGRTDPHPARNASGRRVAGQHPGCGGLYGLGVSVSGGRPGPLPQAPELGELLGLDAGLPQLGRGPATLGSHYQAGQRPGPVLVGPAGDQCIASGRYHAAVVQGDSPSARIQDRAGGRDAALSDDRLAYPQEEGALRPGEAIAREGMNGEMVSEAQPMAERTHRSSVEPGAGGR